jgi:hypothetical protein
MMEKNRGNVFIFAPSTLANSAIIGYNSTGAQEHRSTGAQEHRSTGAQEHRSTGAQEHRSTSVFRVSFPKGNISSPKIIRACLRRGVLQVQGRFVCLPPLMSRSFCR